MGPGTLTLITILFGPFDHLFIYRSLPQMSASVLEKGDNIPSQTLQCPAHNKWRPSSTLIKRYMYKESHSVVDLKIYINKYNIGNNNRYSINTMYKYTSRYMQFTSRMLYKSPTPSRGTVIPVSVPDCDMATGQFWTYSGKFSGIRKGLRHGSYYIFTPSPQLLCCSTIR